MKRFLSKQLTNIVFLVLIVGAALTIYLLSRDGIVSSSAAPQAENTATTQAENAETPQEEDTGTPLITAAPTPATEPSAQSSPHGVPVSVFQTHLETSDLFAAKQSQKDDESWTLTYESTAAVTAQTRYTINDGCVSSIEITFTIPQEFSGKASNDIEKYMKEHSDAQAGETPDAVRALLGDLLPACDMQNRLSATTARYWAEQALLLKKNGTDYEDTQSGCRFIAYRTDHDDKSLLVCTMTFN